MTGLNNKVKKESWKKNLKKKNNLVGFNKYPHLRKQNQLKQIKFRPVRIESRKFIYIANLIKDRYLYSVIKETQEKEVQSKKVRRSSNRKLLMNGAV